MGMILETTDRELFYILLTVGIQLINCYSLLFLLFDGHGTLGR